MQEKDDVCHCGCHERLLMHIVPCCMICEHCGERIKLTRYTDHIKACKASKLSAVAHEVEEVKENVSPK